MIKLVQFLASLAFLYVVKGHGNIVKPASWADSEKREWFYDENGVDYDLGCCVQDYPKDVEYLKWTQEMDNLKDRTCLDCVSFWFNNHVEIPGESTIPYEMSRPDITCALARGYINPYETYPWQSPGSAPVYGPCGTMGGLPNGCNDDGVGNFGDNCNDCNCGTDSIDTSGDQCDCGAFAFGKPAEQYEWPNAPTTIWKRGTNEEVTWYIWGNHAGGYAYRLCKVPVGGFTELTEECFQNGHLEYADVDKQQVVYEKDRYTQERTEIDAMRFTEGTTPPGSTWTTIPFTPKTEDHGDEATGEGHIIDQIKVPADLEPGRYVLSFRWDSKCSREVFSFCSNVEIV